MRLEVPTTTDGVVPFERIGRVELPGLGSLDVWWLDSYGGGVFVPVKDALAGRGTYGGGRYLVDTVKGADLGGRRRRAAASTSTSRTSRRVRTTRPGCAPSPLRATSCRSSSPSASSTATSR